MVSAPKLKTLLTLDVARDLRINISAVAEAALIEAVACARREKWLAENAEAFAAQSDWHERHTHPRADIMIAPGGSAWKT